MKKIAITGGKGGTGKSTYSILLFNKLISQNKKVVLVDVDVECPNDYLLTGQKLGRVIDFVYAKFPKLDKSKCLKCGKCVKACTSNAIFQAPKQYPVFLQQLCSACGACWITCPQKAIKPVKKATGKIYVNRLTNNNWLITGLAKAGLEETGPVVAKVKEFALKFAEQNKADYILFDTAAGTHCPVIQGLANVDFAYAVTEPTPMGYYDLEIILDLCQKLKVPYKIVLNQADLGDKKLIKRKIDQEIPYSQELAKAYANGQLLDFKLNKKVT